MSGVYHITYGFKKFGQPLAGSTAGRRLQYSEGRHGRSERLAHRGAVFVFGVEGILLRLRLQHVQPLVEDAVLAHVDLPAAGRFDCVLDQVVRWLALLSAHLAQQYVLDSVTRQLSVEYPRRHLLRSPELGE